MIVKVQLPLSTNDSDEPWLIYDKTRKKVYTMLPNEEIPDEVRAVVVKHGGKAFFHIIEHGDLFLFGKEADWQEW